MGLPILALDYAQDGLFKPPMMNDAFVPSNNQIQTLGPASPIEDSEFKDVGEPVEGVAEAKSFSAMALLGLAALGYFIFVRK